MPDFVEMQFSKTQANQKETKNTTKKHRKSTEKNTDEALEVMKHRGKDERDK
mgnify:CR=1 FL=1